MYRINVYLPFAFCYFDLLVQIPTQRHQYHGIIWCMLQNNLSGVFNLLFITPKELFLNFRRIFFWIGTIQEEQQENVVSKKRVIGFDNDSRNS